MRLRNILILAFFNAFVFALGVQAQEMRISGTVSDAMGPIMMCNVVEIDNNNRIVSNAQTDFNGNFSMTVKNAKNKLRVSYVGYKTVTLPIGTRTKFNITMQDATQIKEYLTMLDLLMEVELRYLPHVNQRGSITVITQPGLRYAQATALVNSMLLDEQFSALSAVERTRILERILSEIKGRMMEDIVLLETKLANHD